MVIGRHHTRCRASCRRSTSAVRVKRACSACLARMQLVRVAGILQLELVSVPFRTGSAASTGHGADRPATCIRRPSDQRRQSMPAERPDARRRARGSRSLAPGSLAPLDYRLLPACEPAPPGTRVLVPLGSRRSMGVVVDARRRSASERRDAARHHRGARSRARARRAALLTARALDGGLLPRRAGRGVRDRVAGRAAHRYRAGRQRCRPSETRCGHAAAACSSASSAAARRRRRSSHERWRACFGAGVIARRCAACSSAASCDVVERLRRETAPTRRAALLRGRGARRRRRSDASPGAPGRQRALLRLSARPPAAPRSCARAAPLASPTPHAEAARV